MTIGTPETITQFAIETRQHLDEIEAILLEAQWEAPDEAAIAASFRGFHSIKGLARLLDLQGLENLTHHAESLLGEVRSGRLALEPAIQTLLIETLDTARSLCEHAIAGDRHATAEDTLLAALDTATRQAHDKDDNTSASLVGQQSADTPLHADPEMLAYFAEMLLEFLPDLAGLASGEGDSLRAAQAIDSLMIGAERLRLEGLHSRLDALRVSDQGLAVHRLAAIIVDSRRLGRTIDRETGANALSAAIAKPLLRAQAAAAQYLLTALQQDVKPTKTDIEALTSLMAAVATDNGDVGLALHALSEPTTPGATAAAATLLTALANGDALAIDDALASVQSTLSAARVLSPGERGLPEDRTGDVKKKSGEDALNDQVRVPVEILDKLFGRLGEFFSISGALNVLVADSEVPNILQRLADVVAAKAPEQLPAIELLQRQQRDLADIEAETQRLISQIHEATLGLRVIPLDTVLNRFPRMIRDLAQAEGKSIRFEARTDGIKLDKGMLELLGDPLMHMLRNAVSHGIESPQLRTANGKPALATISLRATQNGNRISIEITDDGGGIDTERVRQRAVRQGLVTESESQRLSQEQIYRFIFTPGFSTAESVTDISGRGVGMDVALVNVSRLGGRIDIRSRVGIGTTFHLDLPLSAAILTVLLAETAVQTLAFPERMVVESATVEHDAVQYVNGQRSILLHERFLPIFRAAELLGLPEPGNTRRDGDLSIIVAAVGGSRYGIVIERVLRRHELLIRETHPRVAQLPGIAGVATLGTDRIVLVIDPEELTQLSRRFDVPGLRSTTRAAG